MFLTAIMTHLEPKVRIAGTEWASVHSREYRKKRKSKAQPRQNMARQQSLVLDVLIGTFSVDWHVQLCRELMIEPGDLASIELHAVKNNDQIKTTVKLRNGQVAGDLSEADAGELTSLLHRKEIRVLGQIASLPPSITDSSNQNLLINCQVYSCRDLKAQIIGQLEMSVHKIPLNCA